MEGSNIASVLYAINYMQLASHVYKGYGTLKL